MTGTGRALKLAAISALVALVACGGATPPPPPVEPPEPLPPVESPEPPPSDEPVADAATTPDEPAADAAPTGRPPSGRPPMFFSSSLKISEQLGETPAAKLELGGAEGAWLRVPEYALRNGVLVTFAIDKKAKRHKGASGETYRLQAQMPPSAEFSTVESAGPAFELKLPKTGAASNLAVGEGKVDEQGKETVTWRVVAPKNVDDASKAALFELTGFTNAILHLTTEGPTG